MKKILLGLLALTLTLTSLTPAVRAKPTAAQLAANAAALQALTEALTNAPATTTAPRRTAASLTASRLSRLAGTAQPLARTFVYTLATLGPTDPPTLQFTNDDHLIVNCYTNSMFYLETATNLPGPWSVACPVVNGQVMQIIESGTQEFYRLRRIDSRFFFTLLSAPNATPPDAAFLVPEWTLGRAYWSAVTNTTVWWPVFSNTLIYPCYPFSVTNLTSDWTCALVVEMFTDTNGFHAVTNAVKIPAGYNWTGFEVGLVARLAGNTNRTNPTNYLGYVPASINALLPIYVPALTNLYSPSLVGTNSSSMFDPLYFGPSFFPLPSPTSPPPNPPHTIASPGLDPTIWPDTPTSIISSPCPSWPAYTDVDGTVMPVPGQRDMDGTWIPDSNYHGPIWTEWYMHLIDPTTWCPARMPFHF